MHVVTPGNIVFGLLVPRAIRKPSTCLVYSAKKSNSHQMSNPPVGPTAQFINKSSPNNVWAKHPTDICTCYYRVPKANMKVNGRKRRHESSSDEEDETMGEKENKRLTNRVKELVLDGEQLLQEKLLAIKTKESVEVGEDQKQLEEALKENKRLVDRVKGLEKSLATKTEENVKVGEGKELLEADRRQLKEERGHFEEEKKTVKEGLEEERAKVEKEKVQVEEEKVRVEEERLKMEKMLKEQQKLVECPVCLTLPREDRAVPCCPQGHFVCSPCMDQLTR